MTPSAIFKHAHLILSIKMETFTQGEHVREQDIGYESKTRRVLRDGSDTDLDLEAKGAPL